MSDLLAINTLKMNGVAAINKANSGHPGIVLGSATIVHTLFTKHMKYDPKHPNWINRDRFILSAGHGSALLYSELRLLGLINQTDLMNFRQMNSKTPGHPEYKWTKGVEATTGPLGQGIAMAVGLAVAEESLRSRFKEVSHYTYALCGDGDLQEGVAMEAMSFAGTQELSKLIVLHDSNDIQLDTPVKKVFKENLKMRMTAIGWNYIKVSNNTVKDIDAALKAAKKSKKPTFIEVKTIIGEGATKQGTSDVHGAPIGDDIDNLRKNLKWTYGDFEVPTKVKELYQKTIFNRGAKEFKNFKPSTELKKFIKGKKVSINLELPKNVATRVTSGEVVKHLNETYLNWMGGSADLSASTKAAGGDGEFNPKNRKGRNILFGVREFAMGAIANGMALHSNFKPFVSTFFVFSDYLKPAVRLAALMGLPVTYIFTHDSVFVGEDGPTHEPVEHLAMFRSLPNVNVIRPADEVEVKGAYEVALNSESKPTLIIATRQNIASLENTSKEGVLKGAYKIRKTNKNRWTLVASGSEVANAFEIGQQLDLNVVSLPNANIAKVNWNIDKAITIEAATTFGMAKFGKHNFGIDQFGESGDGTKVYEHFKLDKKSLLKRIKSITK